MISFALCLCVIKNQVFVFSQHFRDKVLFHSAIRSLKVFIFDSALAGTALGLVKEILCELQYRWRMRRLSGIEIALKKNRIIIPDSGETSELTGHRDK